MDSFDDQLMQLSAGGDHAAFEQLVRRWETMVGRVLSRLVVKSAERDDLCQEVFLRIYLARSRYRGNGQFKSWLFRIVLNVARDAGRRAQRRNSVTLPAESELPGRVDDLPDFEIQRGVRDAVAELSPDVREAIVLKHFAELTFNQIATLTGSPASTIKSRVQQGLRELRTHMIKRGLSPQELLP
ncbi:MAG: RNA polymerase sigma factor [Planctomycetota bacterium]